ncbi:MAG: CehA/McbA family metallohydrolase [Phycisphaerales bacterium]|nr:MAG: CehA/McbA family metallohydrolase [Phycisphaerales bacterium]
MLNILDKTTRWPAYCVGLAVLTTARVAAGQPTRPALPPNTIWADEAADREFSEPLRVSSSRLAEYPAIAAVASELFVAWTEHDGGRDQILLAAVADGRAGKAHVISGDSASACWPALTAVGEDGLCAAWAAKRQGRWTIAIRTIRPQLDDHITYVPFSQQDVSSNRWTPAIAAADGAIYLAWHDTDGRHSRIVATRFDDPAAPGEPSVVSGPGAAFRPAMAARDGECWLAWDEVAPGRQYEVHIARLTGDGAGTPIRVTRHPSLDAAPALAIDDRGRVWTAWHSDRSESRQWDIPKWVHVRCFDGKDWFTPREPVPGMWDDPRGEDQGFEFPTLCFDTSGELWLFGRPSHGFNAVRYAGSNWSHVYRFNKPGWGGRGQRVRCAAVDNAVWTVRRDLQHILLQRVNVGTAGGTPPVVVPVEAHGAAAEEPPAAPAGAWLEASAFRLPDEYRIFFGDMHMHSWLSDGVGSPDGIYARARDAYGFDFAALTDHDDFIGNRILPSEWDRMTALANLFNDPGRFATLCAFEWTDPRFPKGDGHKNVYYRDTGPMLWHTAPPTVDAASLVAKLRKLQGFCVPHHIGWTGMDRRTHDPVGQPVMEICSVHGAYEFMGNLPIKHRGGIRGCFVQDGLSAGRTFGLVAGSDSHGLAWHHGIARRRNPWTHGLTAVLATELSRQAVWDALAARRCYATSGPKIALDFRVDDHVMGSACTATGSPVITARVAAPSRLQYVTVVRNGEDIYTTGGDVNSARVRIVDEDWPPAPGVRWYYYLRVVQLDGEMAWSSPIFVSDRAPGPGAKSPADGRESRRK